MHRRTFFQRIGLGALASSFSLPMAITANSGPARRQNPARIRPGAVVGLIAPASPVSEEKIEKTLANLAMFGFQVREGRALRARHGYLAGTDEQRLADLHWAFSDPDVEVVWCARGGYGTTRLLPHIDYDLIRRHPKPFIGYSDVTALHLAIGQKSNLRTFHGPVGASDFPEDTLRYFKAALMEPVAPFVIEAPTDTGNLEGPEFEPYTIAGGQAEGVLVGGNLSLLGALCGTPYQPEFRHKIAFIEEVGEQPYRVDRLLTQLLQATDLSKAAGIVLGVFADCAAKTPEYSLTLPETLRDRLGRLGIPVFYGLPFGHVSHQATFPYGIPARIDADQRTLTFLETGVR